MSEVKVDTISERTAAGGVTIDGVLVKDGVATFQTAAGSPLVFEGATADAFETTFAITDPTADRTITFPDADVTLGASETNAPYFYAYLSATQTGLADTTWTKIACDTVVAQTGTTYDNSSNYRWTPGVSGTYIVTQQVEMQWSGVDSYIMDASMSIYKNTDDGGGEYITSMLFNGPVGTVRTVSSVNTAVMVMNATDYIELWGKVDSYTGTSQANGGATQPTRFMAYRLII
jgi:hypothetical protein